MISRTENSLSALLDPRAFSYYDLAEYDWDATPGEFGILVGTHSRTSGFRERILSLPDRNH
jgi:hypothetical protein